MNTILSIIIPTFNDKSVLQTTLTALQVYRDNGQQIIVVDGHSTDNSQQIAHTLADQVLVTEKNRAKQMNVGARMAKGEILLFLNPGSFLPEYVDFMLAVSLLSTRKQWGCFKVHYSQRTLLLQMMESFLNWRSRITGIVNAEQAIFIHRRLYEKVQGFPEIPLLEDISMSQQLRKMSRPLCLQSRIVLSNPHWAQQGIIKTILRRSQLRFAYALGVNPWTLEKRYLTKQSPNP